MECPNCGEDNVRTRWTKGRKLQKYCSSEVVYDCNWEGEPYTPHKKPIRSTKMVSHYDGGNWEYELFDQYGYPVVFSQGFSKEEACVKAAKKDIERLSRDPNYGKCTAIIWPKSVKVIGKRITL